MLQVKLSTLKISLHHRFQKQIFGDRLSWVENFPFWTTIFTMTMRFLITLILIFVLVYYYRIHLARILACLFFAGLIIYHYKWIKPICKMNFIFERDIEEEEEMR